MSDAMKFWIQTLIVPVVLAVVGYFINDTLQRQQRAFDKIKFADQIINEAFDSDNPDKALAHTRILPVLIDDKEFTDNLVKMINDYYIKKAEQALKASNEAAYKTISDAATVFSGNGIIISDSLKTNPVTRKAEAARFYENAGIVHLQQGDLTKAHQNFLEADKVYPGFHSAYEIAGLLKRNIKAVSAGANETEVKQHVMDTIQKKYSWKLNPTMFKKAN